MTKLQKIAIRDKPVNTTCPAAPIYATHTRQQHTHILVGLFRMVQIACVWSPSEMHLRVLPSLRPKRMREHGVAVPQRVGRKYGVAVGLVVVTVVAKQPTTQRFQQALAAECDTNASRERRVQIVTQTHCGKKEQGAPVCVQRRVVAELNLGRLGCSNQLRLLFRQRRQLNVIQIVSLY